MTKAELLSWDSGYTLSITKRHTVSKAELFSWDYCLIRKIMERVYYFT